MDALFSVQDDEFDLSDDDDLLSFGCQFDEVENVNLNKTPNSQPKNTEKRQQVDLQQPSGSLLGNTPDSSIQQRMLMTTGSRGPSLSRSVHSNQTASPRQINVPSPGLTSSDNCTPARKRRFPGPAGNLPALCDLSGLNNTTPLSKHSRPQSAVTPASALKENLDTTDFDKPVWLFLKDGVQNSRGIPQYDIATVLSMASHGSLENGKVPLLIALLKAFTFTGCDAIALLRDPSGEIRGTVHRAVLEKHQADLTPGAGLVLRQTSVFSPNAKRHYLNITPSNIATVVPATARDSHEISLEIEACLSKDASQWEKSCEQNPGQRSDDARPERSKRAGVPSSTRAAVTSSNDDEFLDLGDDISDDLLAQLDDDTDFLLAEALDST